MYTGQRVFLNTVVVLQNIHVYTFYMQNFNNMWLTPNTHFVRKLLKPATWNSNIIFCLLNLQLHQSNKGTISIVHKA